MDSTRIVAPIAPGHDGLVIHDSIAPGRTTTNPYKAAVVPFAWILTTFAETADDKPLLDAINAIVERLPGGVGGWGSLQAAAEDDSTAEPPCR